jgi:hypothetical protein
MKSSGYGKSSAFNIGASQQKSGLSGAGPKRRAHCGVGEAKKSRSREYEKPRTKEGTKEGTGPHGAKKGLFLDSFFAPKGPVGVSPGF